MIRLMMKQRYHQLLPIVLFCIMIARYYDENYYMNDSTSMTIPCHSLTEKKEVTEVGWPTFALPVAISIAVVVVAVEQEQHLPLLSPRQLTTPSSASVSTSSSSSSSLLWRYSFIYDQCELGYFVPMMMMMITTKPNDSWSNTTRFRMIRTTSTGTMMKMTNTIAPVVHNNSICLPQMGIVVNATNTMTTISDEPYHVDETDSVDHSTYNTHTTRTGTGTVSGAIVAQFNMQDMWSLPQRGTNPNDQTNHLDGNEMSLEFWIRIPTMSSSSKRETPPISIVTIGPPLENTTATSSSTTLIQETTGDYVSRDKSSIPEDTTVSDCDASPTDLQLSYKRSTQEWTLTLRTARDSGDWNPLSESCRTVTATMNRYHHNNNNNQRNTALVHVLLSIQDQQQVLYINGQSLITLQESMHISTDWHPEYIFHLLSPHFSTNDNAPSSSMKGLTILYQFSIYSTALGQHPEEITDVILHHSLPSILPWAYNQSIMVNEDAELIPGSHYKDSDIAWYRTASSARSLNETAHLNGPYIIDVDRDLDDLVRDVLGNHSSATSSLPSINMYIVALPHLGQLYFCDDILNSSRLLSSSTTNEQSSSVFNPVGIYDPNIPRLKYVPPQNAISYPNTYTSFQYCITTRVIFDIHQCPAIAVADIVIVPVNDPPIALFIPTIHVPESSARHLINHTDTNTPKYCSNRSEAPKIRLHGSDVDLEDKIVEVQLVHGPRLGYLSLIVTSFRHDMLLHGTRLNENAILSNFDPVYVTYTFDRSMVNNTNLIVQNNDVKDYFTYRVRDRQGWWSMEERVEIHVSSTLMVYAEPIVRMHEDSIQSLQWHGSDASIRDRPYVQFYVEKIPSLEVGILMHPQSNTPIRQPGIIMIEPPISMNELKVFFQSSQNFCHANTHATVSPFDNEIRFRIVSSTKMNASNGTFIDSVSDPFTQTIWIECILDALELTGPDAVPRSIVASSLQRTTADPCHALQWINRSGLVLNGISCPSAAFITGWKITSIDQRAAMVLVTITTKLGAITLHPQYWNRSNFISGRPILSAGTISFRAYPDDLTSILSSLHYQSYVVGNDTIDIELQYGTCTFDEQQSSIRSSANMSYRASTCQILRRSIPIEIIQDQSYNQRHGRWHAKFPWQLLFCLIVYPTLYVLFVYLEMWCYDGMNDDGVRNVNRDGTIHESEERYIQHEDDCGMIYFEDVVTGVTHWSIPQDESSVRCRNII